MDIPCRSKNVNKYYKVIVYQLLKQVIAEVGSGTYGKVYKAECLKTKDYVALKKIDTKDQKIISEGFPITAIREIKLLKMMSHKNIIRLREIIVSKASVRNNYRGSTFLVFDYMDHDFAALHRLKNIFNLSQLKCIFRQILEGVKYLHENKIIHRDLKSANLLLNNNGEVTIADFGLARTISSQPNAKYTYKVVTLWYRAPELLLGQSNYTSQIDMWSTGCIFAELLTGEVLFKGDTDYRQMEKIYEICGSANEFNQGPECVKLKQYDELKPRRNYERNLQTHLKNLKPLDQYTLDLIDNLLTLDPTKRLTAAQALNHEFFRQEPKPCTLKEMPKLEKEFHETLLKNEMKHQQQNVQNLQRTKSLNTSMQSNHNPDKPFQMHGLQKFQSHNNDAYRGSYQAFQKLMESKSVKDEREKKERPRDTQNPNAQDRQLRPLMKEDRKPSPQTNQSYNNNLDDILNFITTVDEPNLKKKTKIE